MQKVAVLVLSLFIPVAVWAQEDPIADSLAQRVLEAAGGPGVWSRVPYLAFSFGVEENRQVGRVVRHLWNRNTNQYRLETPGPTGEPYVILFDVDTRQGKAYWGGVELGNKESATRVAGAFQRFVNDTFWLLMPFRLFDAGVERAFLPDSSNDVIDVLRVRFTLPDRAPTDEVYLYIARETGRIVQWKYRTPADGPDAPLRGFEWRDYTRYVTSVGEVVLSIRKRALGRPFEVVMASVRMPQEVPDDWFTTGVPRLTPGAVRE